MDSSTLKARKRLVWIAAILCLITLCIDSLFFNDTLEDAFITFRYAKHLGQGYGIGAWNTTGERVEGFTPFLWMLLLGGASVLNLPLVLAAKIMGVCAHLGIVILLLNLAYFIDERQMGFSTRRAGFLAALVVTFSLPLSFYASSGMETTLFAFLGLLYFLITTKCLLRNRGTFFLIPLTIALLLIRPEGLFVAASIQLFAFFVAKREGKSVRFATLCLMTLGASFGLLTLYRLVTFGYPLPNTYYAKATGGIHHLILGMRYVRSYLLTDPKAAVVVISCIILVVSKKKRVSVTAVERFIWVFLLLYFLYVMKVGGDNLWAFPYFRHMLSIIPFIILALVFALMRLFPQRLWLFAGVIVGGCVFLAHTNTFFSKEYNPIVPILEDTFKGGYSVSFREPEPNAYIDWVRDTFDKNTLIATSMAGEFPYYVDAHFIDALGLNDTHIAHQGIYQPGAVDTKSDTAYVLSRKPQIIESTIRASHILRNLPIRRGISYWRLMEEGLIRSETFREDYLFIVNAPYQAMDRALFIRRDFYQQLPNKHKLTTVPVTATSLYRDQDALRSRP